LSSPRDSAGGERPVVVGLGDDRTPARRDRDRRTERAAVVERLLGAPAGLRGRGEREGGRDARGERQAACGKRDQETGAPLTEKRS
jgi:hypothetical protein